VPQNTGTAVHSLAGERLQELESLVGSPSKRQKQEEVVGVTMGSMYSGEALYSWVWYMVLTIIFFSRYGDGVFLDNHAVFLLTLTSETVATMYSLFLALVLFPHVQRRAQAELDVVIGRDRLPTFDDRPRLPYIEALCKELMRWQIVAPMGTV
jgi:hypothetical protein